MTIGGIPTVVVIGDLIGALARPVLPDRWNTSILLTVGVSTVAALIGTALARPLGVADTPGTDRIELVLQVAVPAIGVSVVGAIRTRR